MAEKLDETKNSSGIANPGDMQVITNQPNTGKSEPGTVPSGNGKTTEIKLAPTVESLLGTLSPIASLSEDARKYIENIRTLLKERSTAAMPFNVRELSNPRYEGVLIDNLTPTNSQNNSGIVILFSDNDLINDTPVGYYAGEIVKQVQQISPTVNLRQIINLTKADYDKYAQMTAFIINDFTMAAKRATEMRMSASTLAHSRLRVVTNLDLVRAFAAKYSPHGVQARCDIGFVLCREYETTGPNGAKTTEQDPIMAVMGYTRFLQTQNMVIAAQNGVYTGQQKASFVALPTITEIISRITDYNILPLAFCIAADWWIGKGSWLLPYKRLGKTDPNIGNLITVNGKLQPCTTVQDVDNCAAMFISRPLLAVDVSEGRARPTGLSMLTDANRSGMLANAFCQFFNNFQANGIAQQFNKNPVSDSFDNYTGYFMDKTGLKDSRCVDYLSLASITSDPRTVASFLLQPQDPAVTFGNIRNLYPGEQCKALYRTTTAVFNPDLIGWMVSALATAGVNLMYDMPQNGNYNIDMLASMQNANIYQSMAPLAAPMATFLGSAPNQGSIYNGVL